MAQKLRTKSEKEKSEFDSKLIDVARVVRVAAGGKRFRFRATVVVGNRKGKVGVGVDKGTDIAQAIEKATRDAKKHLIEIPIVEGTIAYSIYGKYSAARMLLRPQRKGKGIVAGGAVRTVCEYVGIFDVSGKILSRTSNKLNIARATIEALKQLKRPSISDATTKEEKSINEDVSEPQATDKGHQTTEV